MQIVIIYCSSNYLQYVFIIYIFDVYMYSKCQLIFVYVYYYSLYLLFKYKIIIEQMKLLFVGK